MTIESSQAHSDINSRPQAHQTYGHQQHHRPLISLTDYAAKYRVSITTLRRRVRANQMEHQFLNGKYYVYDLGAESSPSQIATSTSAASVSLNGDPGSESVLTSTATLLTEIKQAYALILQEKEEQICALKNEIADLKTLVGVLEATKFE